MWSLYSWDPLTSGYKQTNEPLLTGRACRDVYTMGEPRRKPDPVHENQVLGWVFSINEKGGKELTEEKKTTTSCPIVWDSGTIVLSSVLWTQQNESPAPVVGPSVWSLGSRITCHMGEPVRVTGSGEQVLGFALGLNSTCVTVHYFLACLQASVSSTVSTDTYFTGLLPRWSGPINATAWNTVRHPCKRCLQLICVHAIVPQLHWKFLKVKTKF